MSGPVADEFENIAARLKEIEQETAARLVAVPIEVSTEVKGAGDDPHWAKTLIHSTPIS